MPSLPQIIGLILSACSFAVGIYRLNRPKPHPQAAGVFLVAFGTLVLAATTWWFVFAPPAIPEKQPNPVEAQSKAAPVSSPAKDSEEEKKRRTRSETDKAIEHLRTEHGVRPLTDLEEDLPVSKLPDGVYGFCWPDYLPEADQSRLTNQPTTNFDFEVHKLRNGSAFVVGFVGQQTALQLETGTISGKIVLFRAPWDEASSLVSIPLDRITSSECRKFRDGEMLEIEIMPRRGKSVRTPR
jgi:hypothetical protein